MRTYKTYGYEDTHIVRDSLEKLASERINKYDYREAFLTIGKELGRVILHKLPDNYKVSTLLACASEDADWLAKGVMDGLESDNLPIAVFWTKRFHLGNVDISPIIKSYQDEVEGTCETLIIVKSIISSSCVVKTQLLRLISRFTTKQIFIVAPVMYKDAEKNLIHEFPKDISEKFSFITFAIDDEIKENVIIPGIGGWVYPRLGFENEEIKNRYIPHIVLERMAL